MGWRFLVFWIILRYDIPFAFLCCMEFGNGSWLLFLFFACTACICATVIWDLARGVCIGFPHGVVVFESDMHIEAVQNEIMKECRHSIHCGVLLSVR